MMFCHGALAPSNSENCADVTTHSSCRRATCRRAVTVFADLQFSFFTDPRIADGSKSAGMERTTPVGLHVATRMTLLLFLRFERDDLRAFGVGRIKLVHLLDHLRV